MASSTRNRGPRSFRPSPPLAGPRIQNQRIPAKPNYDRGGPRFHDDENVGVHALLAGLAYSKTQCPISGTKDALNVSEFVGNCQPKSVDILLEHKCTRDALLQSVANTASLCGPDDFFLFYFSGHGANVAEVSGNPADAGQEAFVCIDESGQMSIDTLLTGDDFARCVLKNCHPPTRILIITDCCHMGPVVDITGTPWLKREAVALSGCRELTSANDVSRGGIFTHQLLLAVDKLAKVGLEDFSVAVAWNAILHEDQLIFGGMQEMIVQASPGFSADRIAWPLVTLGYEAPLNRMQATGSKSGEKEYDAEQLKDLGIHQMMLKHVRAEHLRQPISVEMYTENVMADDVSGEKGPCRVCFYGAGQQCVLQ